jgi:phage terminase large subunit
VSASPGVVKYQPRPQFVPYHRRRKRWACIVAHRRFGKTVGTVFDLVTCALGTQKPAARFAYIAPFLRQAKQVAWDYLKQYVRPLGARVQEAELYVELPNGNRVYVFGADNPDALRGMYLDGVVLDEFGDMRPTVWGEIIRPLLADRKGWATFIGTPKGKNHFWAIRQEAANDPNWLFLELKASSTGVLDEQELESARAQMTPEQYAQEFECEFNVPALGAIYRAEYTAAQESNRLTRVAYDPAIPVHTAWDLGVGDATSIWFTQKSGSEIRLIDYYEKSGEGIQHYAKVLKERPYVYGRHIAPHDIEVRDFSAGGKSRREVAQTLGITFQIAPKLDLEDGINAARLIWPRCYFDAQACARGLECLQNYRREYAEKLGQFKPQPVHDWASHGADAFRYLAVAESTLTNDISKPLKYPALRYA